VRGGESRGERSSTFRFNFTAVTVSLSWYGRRWKPGGRRTEEEDDDVAGREIRVSTQGTHASAIDEPRMGRRHGVMELDAGRIAAIKGMSTTYAASPAITRRRAPSMRPCCVPLFPGNK